MMPLVPRPVPLLAAARYLPPLLGLAVAGGSIGLVVAGTGPVTTYAGVSTPMATVALAPGLALVAVGAAAAWYRPTAWLGPLAVLLGLVWLAPLWVGWQGQTPPRSLLAPPGAGPDLVRTLAMVVAPLLYPLLAQLVLGLPAGRLGGRRRLVLAAGYAAAAALGIGHALFYAPVLDPYCWNNCSANSFLVLPDPELARRIGMAGRYAAAAAGLSIGGAAAWRLARAADSRPWAAGPAGGGGAAERGPRGPPGGRSALWYVLGPAAIAAVSAAAYPVALIREPVEDPARPVFAALFVVRATALALLAAGLAGAVLRHHRQRFAVARLADDLGSAPPLGSLRAALAQALGDNRVEVAYWLPDARRYVDAAGRPVDPVPGQGRAVTAIHRGGQPVAAVVHDRALYDADLLAREIGSAARLAIDNERLRAALFARLDDLRASRARVVVAGDEARRRLERDLHDGAQQRLLAVSFELRLARAAAAAEGDEQLATTLAVAVVEIQAALAELREIAHGIFPAILDEAGLGPALCGLADGAPVPLQVDAVPDARLPAAVERAAYVAVAEAVDAAGERGSPLRVRVEHGRGLLVMEVLGVAAGRYDHVADRVGALGGRVTVDRRRMRVEIPCD
ncbi:hypothetical protein K1W54_19530 [Micromonospora sp. CPCC 205371]|nr:hypothetical protein [Micromonospora sp. CPCC 205371]